MWATGEFLANDLVHAGCQRSHGSGGVRRGRRRLLLLPRASLVDETTTVHPQESDGDEPRTPSRCLIRRTGP